MRYKVDDIEGALDNFFKSVGGKERLMKEQLNALHLLIDVYEDIWSDSIYALRDLVRVCETSDSNDSATILSNLHYIEYARKQIGEFNRHKIADFFFITKNKKKKQHAHKRTN